MQKRMRSKIKTASSNFSCPNHNERAKLLLHSRKTIFGFGKTPTLARQSEKECESSLFRKLLRDEILQPRPLYAPTKLGLRLMNLVPGVDVPTATGAKVAAA